MALRQQGDSQPLVVQARPDLSDKSATYRTLPAHVNTNVQRILERVMVLRLRGEQDLTDNGSTTVLAKYTIPDGLAAAGDMVIVKEDRPTARVWLVNLGAPAGTLEFDDADLYWGSAGTADYDQIEDDLVVVGMNERAGGAIRAEWVPASILIKEPPGGTGPDEGLYGDALQHSSGDARKLSDILDDIETQLLDLWEPRGVVDSYCYECLANSPTQQNFDAWQLDLTVYQRNVTILRVDVNQDDANGTIPYCELNWDVQLQFSISPTIMVTTIGGLQGTTWTGPQTIDILANPTCYLYCQHSGAPMQNARRFTVRIFYKLEKP